MPRPPSRRDDRRGPGAGGPARDDPDDASSAPRIIGGDLRRRRLAHQPGGRTRPMKDRVRESLFDLLGTTVRRTLAIDLFAGTGALGFEALSRGASHAIFVERHFPTADVLRRSARDLGVQDRCDIRSGDVLLWGRRLPDLPQDMAWVVFVSPPWAFFAADHERRAELLALIDVLRRAAPPGSTLVVESDTSVTAADLPVPDAWESRPIPPAVLHLLRS
jgi:16S rRNA (guanine966-N2)-methyltransferase